MKTSYFYVLVAIILSSSCIDLNPNTIAKTVIDLATATCVIDHSWRQEKEIVEFCNISKDILPHVRKLLASQKKALRYATAKECLSEKVKDNQNE